MLESSFLAEETGLNHILKLCWFTLFEMASSIDESKSACIVGASEGEAPVNTKTWNRAMKEFQVPNSPVEALSSWRADHKERSLSRRKLPLD